LYTTYDSSTHAAKALIFYAALLPVKAFFRMRGITFRKGMKGLGAKTDHSILEKKNELKVEMFF
jgi:hypothetical protein